MVRDNVTGLIWEVKTDDGSVHDKYNIYTWCDTNSETNGGDAGTCGEGTDTEDFINALNTEHFGGFTDWRLPTPKELRSITDRSKYNPAIDRVFFPSTVSDHYWSSTTYADDAYAAWGVYFTYAYGYDYSKSYWRYVRAVRSGQNRSFDHLVLNGDNTVTDTVGGLMWEQKTELNKNDTYTWQAAMGNFINGLNAASFAGYNDWRLPTPKELQSISDLSKYNPAIDTAYFPNTVSSGYCSSTTSDPQMFRAWGMNFNRGNDYSDYKSDGQYVRAVRGGQNRILGHLTISTPRQASFWEKGSTIPIQWDTAGISGNVKISVSYEGGKPATFQTIVAETVNDGQYDWKTGERTSFNCMLKIEPVSLTDKDKGTVQGLFSIGSFLNASPPNVVLEEPADPDTPGVPKTFRILLNNDPGGDVTLSLYSSNPGEFSLSPDTVTLNSTNWNTGEEVTVTPEYDGIADNDQTASVIVSTVSEYAAFQAKEVSAVRVTVRDTDTDVTVQSVYPAYGIADSPLDVTVRGANFSSTTPVYIYPEGGTPAAITPVTVLNETSLQVTVSAQFAGNYHLKVSESVLENALTFATASALDTKKAIIVAGSGPYFDNSLWNATEKCVNKAYRTLTFQGYSAENIKFLSRKLWTDVTGNGENNIDGDATKANLENAIKTWAADNTDELLIYMTGPGGEGTFQFGSNAAPDILTAASLDSWFDTLSCKIIVIYDGCQSGSFLSRLAGNNRILITSTTAEERAWFLDDGELSFSFRFFDALSDNANLIQSFTTAKDNTGSVQTPLIDWTGDGIPDTLSGKRSEPETIIIGRGRITDTSPPEILNVSANPEILLNQETSSTLSASGVTAVNELSRVWGRIIPPAENYVSLSAPVVVLPTIKLLDQNNGTYQNTYEEFTSQGIYNIYVYAKDRKDFQSLPKLLTINQSDGETAAPGDINADGYVTLFDAIQVLKLISGKKVAPAPGSDIDGDDKTELENAVYILQKVANLR